MAKASTEREFFGSTDIGRTRSSNQDFLGNKKEENLFLVADGMGGHVGGERASHLAVDTILDKYRPGEEKKKNFQQIKKSLEQAIQSANAAIFEESLQDHERQQMGTTIVALVLHGGQAVLAHVGDSRIYRLRNSKLEQLTVDHSLVQEQIKAGIIREEDSKNHRMKNVITRALGIEKEVEVDMKSVRVQEGDLFLLCSDGLHGMISDEDILQILLSEPDLERCGRSLIESANENGGKDNVTATLVRVGKVYEEREFPGIGKLLGGVALAAGIVVLAYLLLPLFKTKPSAPPEEDIIPLVPKKESVAVVVPARPALPEPEPEKSIEAKILDLRKTLENEQLPIGTRVNSMMVLAEAEAENDNINGARAVIGDLLSLCISTDYNADLSAFQTPRLKAIVADSQKDAWKDRFSTTNKESEKLRESDLEVYAPEQVEVALSAISQAEKTFDEARFFLALDMLDDADDLIADAIAVSGRRKLEKKKEIEETMVRAKQELDKIRGYIGENHTGTRLKLEIQEAILREAQRNLEVEDYQEAHEQAAMVLDSSRQILAKAEEIEKQGQLAEQQKRIAETVSADMEEKWRHMTSDEVAGAAAELQKRAYIDLEADHEKFQELMQHKNHVEATALGRTIVTRADSLMLDIKRALKKRIAEEELALLARKNSRKRYDKADLDTGARMLDEAKSLAGRQLLSKALRKAEELHEFIGDLKEKPSMSAAELQNFMDASESARTLGTYLRRSIELLNENKRTQAKNLLMEYSKAKFDELSSLIPPGQTALRELFDQAHELCFGGGGIPGAADIEKSLERITLLEKGLQGTIAANQALP